MALFHFNRNLTAVDDQLAVFGLKDIFATHIKCAPKGQKGPVGATLISGSPVTLDSLLAQPHVSERDPENRCGCTSLKQFAEAISSGSACVNVRTLAHPSGEIRAQIRPHQSSWICPSSGFAQRWVGTACQAGSNNLHKETRPIKHSAR